MFGERPHSSSPPPEAVATARRTKHGAFNVRVFGSRSRGEAGPDSDFDFVVKAGPGRTRWFPGGLLADLEDLLGRQVEVLTETGLHPVILDQVLKEAVPL